MNARRQERLAEFHSKEVITVGMGHTNDFRPQISRVLSDRRRRCQWSAGDFERNLGLGPQGTVDRNQGSAGGNVQRGGKFQEVLAVLLMAADENWNRKGQTRPLTSLQFRLSAIQNSMPPKAGLTVLPHLRGQTNHTKNGDYELLTDNCRQLGQEMRFLSAIAVSALVILAFGG